MQIIPFKAIQDVPTGNPNTGDVEIASGKSLLQITKEFPSHEVFKKNEFSKNVTSNIMNDAMHIYYDEDGKCIGAEVMAPYKLDHDHDLVWNEINFFKQEFQEIKNILERSGHSIEIDGEYAEIPDLGLSVMLNEDEKLETVYVKLEE